MGETFDANQIIERLWLGSLSAAQHRPVLKELNFSHILTVGEMPPKYPEEFTYLVIPLEDQNTSNLIEHFTKTHDFIDNFFTTTKETCLLIHCLAGVSRSTTVVISYLMKKLNMSFEEAFEHVRKERRFVNPNQGFQYQLKLFQRLEKSLSPASEGDSRWEPFQEYQLWSRNLSLYQHTTNISVHWEDNTLTSDNFKTNEKDERDETNYYCQHCRKQILTGSQVFSHRNICFPPIWARRDSKKISDDCTYSSVIPMHWMLQENPTNKTEESQQTLNETDKLDEIEQIQALRDYRKYLRRGNINCFHCHKRIGTYDFFSLECPICSSLICQIGRAHV